MTSPRRPRRSAGPAPTVRRGRRSRARRVLLLLIPLLALLGAGGWWLGSTSTPTDEGLAGTAQTRSVTVDGRIRTWVEYRPPRVDPSRPVVLVLHGSSQDGPTIRGLSSFTMDRLADEEGFVVAYPDGIDGNWNECRRGGSFTAKRQGVDDVAFLTRVLDETGGPAAAALVTGYSSGGQMALRMAVEAPERVAAAAPVAASTPTEENFACATPAGPGVPLLFVNGTDDPFNPYEGGEVSFHGFGSRGRVLPAVASAELWARRAGSQGPPETAAEGPLTTRTWRDGRVTVAHLTVQGGGHQFFSCCARGQRLLGPSQIGGLDVSREVVGFARAVGVLGG